MARNTMPVIGNGMLRSPFAEAYRALRTNINFNAIALGVRSLLITSAEAGEGKSTTAVNLAILMARTGKRVILVDADFRRPSLDQVLEADRERRRGVEGFWSQEEVRTPLGFSDMIGAGAPWLEVGQTLRGLDNLVLIPAGPLPPNPAELLSLPAVGKVIIDLCDHADVVLIDTPPCSLYADAIQLTEVTDGVLYVLRAGPQRADHARTLKLLQQGKARLIGVVMNEVAGDAGRYDHTQEGDYRKRG